MVSLRLWYCTNVSTFPPLGQLPSLKHLYISGLEEIERVGAEFYGTEPSFVSLEALSFRGMRKWKEWLCLGGQGGEFSRLKELYIERCPKLIGALPNHLPLLTKLEIVQCEQLVAELPRIPAIRVLTTRSCDISQWKELPPLLQDLSIQNSDSLESLWEEGILQKGDVTSFHWLNIRSCPDLVSIELSALDFSRYSIFKCKNLKRLLHNAACFQSLTIEGCPELIFPIQGLQGLSSLTSLKISDLPNLMSLDSLELQLLTSLEKLEICGCPKLQFLTEGQLPTNLSVLTIQNCPFLKDRCKFWTGEDWHHIAHIPHIAIDDQVLSSVMLHSGSDQHIFIRNLLRLPCLISALSNASGSSLQPKFTYNNKLQQTYIPHGLWPARAGLSYLSQNLRKAAAHLPFCSNNPELPIAERLSVILLSCQLMLKAKQLCRQMLGEERSQTIFKAIALQSMVLFHQVQVEALPKPPYAIHGPLAASEI
ncbi:putative disease resistance RPP13-like protein 1 [Vitis vinifera]|uniref:Putative disease resistance RPP13-like protein 1 n=1 Tax=Vitis vinifera TaxID=29760 RepID=A0A438CMW7_VITVI|nr:putative disease resistance RPP13-like protein 1 [Vitis vinifera]